MYMYIYIGFIQPKGQIPDYGAPVVLHAANPSIEMFCDRIHKQLLAQFKYAWVWGSSVRHQPQKVCAFIQFSVIVYLFKLLLINMETCIFANMYADM